MHSCITQSFHVKPHKKPNFLPDNNVPIVYFPFAYATTPQSEKYQLIKSYQYYQDQLWNKPSNKQQTEQNASVHVRKAVKT